MFEHFPNPYNSSRGDCHTLVQPQRQDPHTYQNQCSNALHVVRGWHWQHYPLFCVEHACAYKLLCLIRKNLKRVVAHPAVEPVYKPRGFVQYLSTTAIYPLLAASASFAALASALAAAAATASASASASSCSYCFFSSSVAFRNSSNSKWALYLTGFCQNRIHRTKKKISRCFLFYGGNLYGRGGLQIQSVVEHV